MKMKSITLAVLLFLPTSIAFTSLNGYGDSSSPVPITLPCPEVPASRPQSPSAVTCNNSALAGYDELLIIAPHPDDEVLGYTGLMLEFIRQKKPVSIVVVTIGDAYCDACSFWKNVGQVQPMLQWGQCSEANLAEFAAIRKGETQSGQQVLGGPPPTFWGYPDTGIDTAWTAINSGTGVDTKLRRSDCTKEGVFGKGSEIDVTPRTLYNQLHTIISKAPSRTLIGTTHPLDGHPDHMGLGNLIRKVNADLAAAKNPATAPKSVAFTVIHANSTLAGYPDHDAWYPSPAAVDGACFSAQKQSCYQIDTTLVGRMREYRYRPEWSFPMPQDAAYVTSIPNAKAVPFCLPVSVYQGTNARKLLAVQKFISQQGFLAKSGSIPPGMGGMVDCNGYQMGFIRSNEMFVLEPY
ncbi:MAG: PIG-L deacetylase family protein [Syntrophales bacterium]